MVFYQTEELQQENYPPPKAELLVPLPICYANRDDRLSLLCDAKRNMRQNVNYVIICSWDADCGIVERWCMKILRAIQNAICAQIRIIYIGRSLPFSLYSERYKTQYAPKYELFTLVEAYLFHYLIECSL